MSDFPPPVPPLPGLPAAPPPADGLAPSDVEHLRLLGIFHMVVAGLTAVCGSIPLLHVAMGAIFMVSPPPSNQGGGPPPAWFGALFMGFGCFAVALAWGLAGAVFYAGRCIQDRRHWTFCLGVAAIMCLNMPIGTALGVFSLIVLMRPQVKGAFGAG